MSILRLVWLMIVETNRGIWTVWSYGVGSEYNTLRLQVPVMNIITVCVLRHDASWPTNPNS